LNTIFHVEWPLWGPALAAAATFIVWRGVWWFTQKSIWCLPAVFAMSILIGCWFLSRYGGWFSAPKYYWNSVTPLEIVTLCTAIGIGYWMAVMGVARDRRGEHLQAFNPEVALSNALDSVRPLIRRDAKPFRSPAEAQLWYEWRQKGFVMPMAVCLAIVFAVAIVSLQYLLVSYFPNPANNELPWSFKEFNVAFLVLGMILTLLGGIAGLWAGQFNSDTNKLQPDTVMSELFLGHHRLYEVGSFQATRPSTESDFSIAILRNAARSLLTAWSLWAVAYILFLFIANWMNQLPNPIIPIEIEVSAYLYFPLTLLGPWIAMTFVAASLLTGRQWSLLVPVLGVIAVLNIHVIVLDDGRKFAMGQHMRLLLNAVFLAPIVVGVVWAYWVAIKRGILGFRFAVIAASLSVALVVYAIAFKPQEMPLAAYATIVAIAALAVAPWATVPLAIHWNRHR